MEAWVDNRMKQTTKEESQERGIGARAEDGYDVWIAGPAAEEEPEADKDATSEPQGLPYVAAAPQVASARQFPLYLLRGGLRG